MALALPAAMVAVAETPAEPCEPGHLLLMLADSMMSMQYRVAAAATLFPSILLIVLLPAVE
jgi:hypothetical protein